MTARLRLRRSDGEIHLDRWGFEIKRVGGIFLHRLNTPDPGVDLHDHPWTFWSFVLRGGYIEERCLTRHASARARWAEGLEWAHRGDLVERKQYSFKSMRLDECHRITHVNVGTWTLVIHGPSRRTWGFYEPEGYVPASSYSTRRRDLQEEYS